jgi:hypothetical protein
LTIKPLIRLAWIGYLLIMRPKRRMNLEMMIIATAKMTVTKRLNQLETQWLLIID